MKLINTQVETNKLIENDNHRKCLIEIDCHQMRILIDGLIEIIGPLERMENKDADDIIRMDEAKSLRTEFKESYRRTKNLLGVHTDE